MYEPRLTPRDRLATFAMVAGIHVALAFVLINISPEARRQLPEEVVEMFDVTEPPPPEEEVVQLQPAPQEDAPREEEGAASPENIRSRATPVVTPKPPIALPIPPPMPVTQTPNTGSESTQGASDRPGPGTGAGGVGTGTGSGGSGSGTGGGGSGGAAKRPVLIPPSLTRRDYPEEVSRYWPWNRSASTAGAVRVQLDGRATDCKITRSSGVPAIDQWTCRLVETRLRFRPATDDRGRPVVAWYGYVQR